jgi:hypothetical protein
MFLMMVSIKISVIIPSLHRRGGINTQEGRYAVLPLSFPRYFSSHFSQRFWTHQIPTYCLPTLLIFIHIEHILYAHFSQQLLMAEIWYFVTIFILVRNIVGSVFGPARFLLPVCRLGWFLYTLNIYAHFSSHFSRQLLMAEIGYLVTSFI